MRACREFRDEEEACTGWSPRARLSTEDRADQGASSRSKHFPQGSGRHGSGSSHETRLVYPMVLRQLDVGESRNATELEVEKGGSSLRRTPPGISSWALPLVRLAETVTNRDVNMGRSDAPQRSKCFIQSLSSACLENLQVNVGDANIERVPISYDDSEGALILVPARVLPSRP